jgi:hypothetical protein
MPLVRTKETDVTNNRSISILFTALLLLLCALDHTTLAATTVPLNTGYDHASFAPYLPVTTVTSNRNDNYWINIASYPPTTPPVASSWVLFIPPAPWLPAFPASHWISARNAVASPSGTSRETPAYTIFRKCFCLLPNYKNATLAFQVRADDTIQVWFNTQLNVALQPTLGNWNFGTPLSSLPSNANWFRVGKNCIYVLLEDIGGQMGFDLAGTIQADGLAPVPAFGPNQTFDCPCRTGTADQASSLRGADDEGRLLRELVKIAEERRLKRAKSSVPPNR